jgi:hypothetical protein
MGGKKLKRSFTNSFKKYARKGSYHDWKYGICPIQKKWDMICNNYRAVTILCTTYKILASISYIKSVPYAEEIIEHQVGF